jgi:hypothetical protein
MHFEKKTVTAMSMNQPRKFNFQIFGHAPHQLLAKVPTKWLIDQCEFVDLGNNH